MLDEIFTNLLIHTQIGKESQKVCNRLYSDNVNESGKYFLYKIILKEKKVIREMCLNVLGWFYWEFSFRNMILYYFFKYSFKFSKSPVFNFKNMYTECHSICIIIFT